MLRTNVKISSLARFHIQLQLVFSDNFSLKQHHEALVHLICKKTN